MVSLSTERSLCLKLRQIPVLFGVAEVVNPADRTSDPQATFFRTNQTEGFRNVEAVVCYQVDAALCRCGGEQC